MNNPTIVITGGTKGIGRAIALKFAQHGWGVALCARNQKDLEEFEQVLKKTSSATFFFRCDVSNKEEVKFFAQQTLAKFGKVDIVVNNAGVFLPGQVITEEEGRLETLIETNLYSAYHFSRALLPNMMQRGSGHIFNLCSVASIQPYPNGGSYSVSKFALLGLSKALREELKAHHIKVTALVAGATYTDSWKESGLPEERFMTAEDIAQTVWDVYHLSAGTVVEEILLRPMLGDI